MAPTQRILSRLSLSVLFAIIAAVLLSCAPTQDAATYRYEPPKTTAPPLNYTMVINQPFDRAWVSLVDYVSTGSFSVRSFEKTTGLIRLAFGAVEPQKFVDCGRWTALQDGRVQSETSYLDGHEEQTSFSGSITLFMKKLDANRTQLRIITGYRLRILFKNSQPATWKFKNVETATVEVANPSRGTIPTRTCRPTYVAEREILKWVTSN